MSTIKAIETHYAGCRFRSRLEARWAVFFDTLGIEWQHEPQGFKGGAHNEETYYLCDFWLPETETWVEVKGHQGALDDDLQKMLDLIDWGSPMWGVNNSLGTSRGVVVLGPVPRPVGCFYDFPTLQHSKGVHLRSGWFAPTGFQTDPDLRPLTCWDSSWGDPGDQRIPLAPERYGIAHGHLAKAAEYIDRQDAGLKAARSAQFEHGASPR